MEFEDERHHYRLRSLDKSQKLLRTESAGTQQQYTIFSTPLKAKEKQKINNLQIPPTVAVICLAVCK